MVLRKINFSHNWNNKLRCDIFTTIRRATDDKRIYYEKCNGNDFDILLDGRVYSNARLIKVRTVQLKYVTTEILLFDTGAESIKEAHEVFKKFGVGLDTEVLILTFKRNYFVAPNQEGV